MKKKLSGLLVLILIVLLSTSVMGKTELRELDNGDFEVTFTYHKDLDADAVYIGGEFNDWSASHPDWEMKKQDGVWKLTTELERGIYEYKFVVNGSNWKKDLEAKYFVDDGLGGKNSVVRVISSAPKGEFRLSGDITSDYEEITEVSGDVNKWTTEINLDLNGTAYKKEQGNNKKFLEYRGRLKLESEMENFKTQEDTEGPTLDTAEVDVLDATYFNHLGEFNVQVGTEDYTDSYDYLKLMDTTLNKRNIDEDDDDNMVNPNQFGKLRMLKFETDKVVDMNLAVQEYSNRRYLGYFNIKKDFGAEEDSDFTLGSTALLYQPKLLGKDEFNHKAKYGAVFGEYRPTDNLALRAEYSYVPTGDIDQSAVQMVENEDGTWDIVMNVQDAINSDPAWDDLSLDDIDRIVLNGSFESSWIEDPDHEYRYELKEVDEDAGIWAVRNLPADTPTEVFNGQGFKTMAFDYNEETYFYPSGMAQEIAKNGFEEPSIPEPLEDGKAYLAEANYKFVDQAATERARYKSGDFSITKYKGDITVGTMGADQDAYLKVASDAVAENPETGYQKYYARGWYQLAEDLKADGELVYNTPEADDPDTENTDETDNPLSTKVKAGVDWMNPTAGLDNLTGEIHFDKYDQDDFNGEQQEVYLEAKSSALPGTKLIKASTTQRMDSDVNWYYLETEFDLPAERIAHLKTNLTYAQDPVTGFENDEAYKFVGEIKAHKLPVVNDYLPYVLLNYTSDEGQAGPTGQGIIEAGDYEGKDNNDWINKITAETKFALPQLEKWHGLTVQTEFKQLEDNVVGDVDNPNQDDEYWVADDQLFMEWYSIVTFKTGYDLPFRTSLDLTFKYDVNHGEWSEYEDDAIVVALEKQITKNSSLLASYNKQDDEEGEDYTRVMYEKIF